MDSGTMTNQAGVVTSAPGAYWQTGGSYTVVASGTPTVTVDTSSPLQSWEGFGGAFSEMGWNVLTMLSASDQAKAMDLLFGADAAHFVIGRIPIGASDFALARYTDDEVPAGATDGALSGFSITEDLKYLIPYVTSALTVNPNVRLWASPWTPPTWMKTTTGTVNGTSCALLGSTAFDGGCMVNSVMNLTTYAQYFVKWVEGYAAHGVNIEAVAPQDEPNFTQAFPSCLWSSPVFSMFIGSYLGPALKQAGLGAGVMLGTMADGTANTDPSLITTVMTDAVAGPTVNWLGYEWALVSEVAADRAKYPSIPIWQTAHQPGNYPFNNALAMMLGETFNANAAPNDQLYGVETWDLIVQWLNAGVTSYTVTNMVLDTVGKGLDTVRIWPQNALLTVNTTTKTLTPTPAYYVLRHLSQFAMPGGHVLGTTGGSALAFQNPDGSIVTVMYNSGAAATYTLSVAGKLLQFQMPGNGWATVDYAP